MNITEQRRQEAREREAERETRWMSEMAKNDQEHADRKSKSKTWIATLRKAAPRDYSLWLDGFLAHGGNVTNTYTYDMPPDFFVATKNIKITDLYGSSSIGVIVPEGIEVSYDDKGHNNIYYMNNSFAPDWVPLYTDT